MAQEKEIKIQLKIQLDDFVKRIQRKGYKLVHKLNQTDIYFDTKDWFLYESIAALRLRRIDNNDSSFSFKKVFYLPKQKDYYVEEIEVKFPINNFDEAKKIFEKVTIPFDKSILKSGSELTKYLAKYNYFDEQKMTKLRTVYSKGEDEITIDEADNVGIIIELECQNNEPLHVVKTFLSDNEWERSVEGTSYIWLKNVKGLTSHIKNLERFKTEPDWNVWENEKEMYEEIQKKQDGGY
ncbi:CYTH domain-containing protein [Candidatus Woesebacteria bacterium]|nr:MAG: CYTH domain-containing protein [Candidatus Woesebacteria bacterium]